MLMRVEGGKMEIDPSIEMRVMEGVYNPAEDSYLLIKSIEVRGREEALDMGCGSGVVALHLARNGCSVIAADINERAVENTRMNAMLNRFDIKCIRSNLFSHVDKKFDIIAFNPPYLPTEQEDIAWDGGRNGTEIIEKFLHDAWKHLKENGRIYLVVSSLTGMEGVIKKFGGRYVFRKVMEESYFFEKLMVYEIKSKG